MGRRCRRSCAASGQRPASAPSRRTGGSGPERSRAGGGRARRAGGARRPDAHGRRTPARRSAPGPVGRPRRSARSARARRRRPRRRGACRRGVHALDVGEDLACAACEVAEHPEAGEAAAQIAAQSCLGMGERAVVRRARKPGGTRRAAAGVCGDGCPLRRVEALAGRARDRRAHAAGAPPPRPRRARRRVIPARSPSARAPGGRRRTRSARAHCGDRDRWPCCAR